MYFNFVFNAIQYTKHWDQNVANFMIESSLGSPHTRMCYNTIESWCILMVQMRIRVTKKIDKFLKRSVLGEKLFYSQPKMFENPQAHSYFPCRTLPIKSFKN